MASQQELEQARFLRLQEFFKDHPDVWDDIKEEINICEGYADEYLKSAHCDCREFYAGKCIMAKEIKDIDIKFKEQ